MSEVQDKGFVSKESVAEGSLLVRQVRDVASDLVLSAMSPAALEGGRSRLVEQLEHFAAEVLAPERS